MFAGGAGSVRRPSLVDSSSFRTHSSDAAPEEDQGGYLSSPVADTREADLEEYIHPTTFQPPQTTLPPPLPSIPSSLQPQPDSQGKFYLIFTWFNVCCNVYLFIFYLFIFYLLIYYYIILFIFFFL